MMEGSSPTSQHQMHLSRRKRLEAIQLTIQLSFPLIKEYGFSRETLARSVLTLPEPPSAPLSDTAVNALFGEGDSARRTLINAWLDEGRAQMRLTPAESISEVLAGRLRYNEPVLSLLPEAFALLASPRSGLPPLDARPALRHATTIADDACHIVGDASVGHSWYTRRASIATVYVAAELHQMSSPETALQFLGSLLRSTTTLESAVAETSLFAEYVAKSWKGIIKSSGMV
ncbi:hypothetical protein K488DRAFT_77831 [Vararia minispora EC-137]|uniref:Uncharacterized protein n=1 Tax=Vararia minispora EC-137 TaxID=1314806 RepID=A0ACB8QPH1_9AGAM|nr:hypothetical protein K488DRAFT_77831 [Vararia minispora EC-137]